MEHKTWNTPNYKLTMSILNEIPIYSEILTINNIKPQLHWWYI
jgi:hypothetical protein